MSTNTIKEFIRLANIVLDKENKEKLKALLEQQEIETRICSNCGRVMIEGYCIDGGMKYFCNDDCLKSEMTLEEFNKLYRRGETDTYWTEWI
ncbi:CDP-alcohol phosphatidyltransferase [Clostridium botulinum]|uniref:CDP-alcohol phosphatidyltransferase n=1 Tax=Clostridium botulinum TaxID=1491 RepID=UPI00174855D8|nr:CDP-alcohol phosphatidyltransferase [Clostridium botulinum]MBD5640072.1 CDP-alcohol phosphatidyltransferase [Clostridium botulinum]MDI6920006.1 CDP-alcohol phosphatidyltransferase [Clostridium botulinum]WMU99617.1 CDP-alcohol phosphatidyltransferase [Clostridium botulinum]